MSQADIKQAVEAAIDYLTQNPEDAKYTDTFATATLTDPNNGLITTVEGPNGAAITTDMPTSVGGTHTGPAPGWFLRAGEASCVATLIGLRAAQLEIPLTEVQVTVDSRSNDWGILGIGEGTDKAQPARPLSTRVAVRIRGQSGVETLEEVARWAVAHCPVTDAVAHPVPIEIELDTSD